jgi:hypothetical protein
LVVLMLLVITVVASAFGLEQVNARIDLEMSGFGPTIYFALIAIPTSVFFSLPFALRWTVRSESTRLKIDNVRSA